MSALADFIAGFKQAAAAGGRLGTVQPYEAGREEALRKYAAPMGLHDKLDLLGLGLLAAPVIHSAIADGSAEDPRIHRIKNIAELAGLGTLAASTLSKAH